MDKVEGSGKGWRVTIWREGGREGKGLQRIPGINSEGSWIKLLRSLILDFLLRFSYLYSTMMCILLEIYCAGCHGFYLNLYFNI